LSKQSLSLYVDARRLSPYAMSAFVALMEKKLPFELLDVKLSAGEQRLPEYRHLSLTGRVPSLVHDGFSVSESSAITEHLEDVFPAPVYPSIYAQGPQPRARARQIQAWLRSDLLPVRNERPTGVVFLKNGGKALSEQGRAAADALCFAAQKLLPVGSANLFGDWCIVDTELALMLNRLAMAGDSLPERLAHYARDQWQRPTVQAWVSMERRNE